MAKKQTPLEVHMKSAMQNVRSYALAVTLVAMTLPGFAQSPGKPIPPDSESQPQTQSTAPSSSSEKSSASQATTQTFQGTISYSQDGYVLKDSSGVTYQLDDQRKAKEFSGQNVKVSGTLDASTNMIRVASIAPAS